MFSFAGVWTGWNGARGTKCNPIDGDHLADQYEAFAKLHSEEGPSAEDIAARFGVTQPWSGSVSSSARSAPSSGRFIARVT
jgi:hypothetical protein